MRACTIVIMLRMNYNMMLLVYNSVVVRASTPVDITSRQLTFFFKFIAYIFVSGVYIVLFYIFTCVRSARSYEKMFRTKKVRVFQLKALIIATSESTNMYVQFVNFFSQRSMKICVKVTVALSRDRDSWIYFILFTQINKTRSLKERASQTLYYNLA